MDYITVSTPAIRTARQDKPATLADYLANIARRFPECVTPAGVANPVALAKRESRAMWIRLGRQHKGEPDAKAENRVEAMRATWQSKAADARQEVINALTKPMTTGDVARVLGIKNQHTAHTRLIGMAEQGLIVQRKVKGMSIWERMTEAAE